VHQKWETTPVQGNWKADRKVKWAALTGGQTSTSLTAALFPSPLATWDPWYLSQEQAWFKTEEGNFLLGGCSSRIASSHICQAVPWRNLLRVNSSGDHLGSAFLCPQALQHM
jgi:hypothetical protein